MIDNGKVFFSYSIGSGVPKVTINAKLLHIAKFQHIWETKSESADSGTNFISVSGYFDDNPTRLRHFNIDYKAHRIREVSVFNEMLLTKDLE